MMIGNKVLSPKEILHGENYGMSFGRDAKNITNSSKCRYCDEEGVVNLDGDDLCKKHADAWCRSEGLHALELGEVVERA